VKPSRVSSTAAEKALARAVEDATADLRKQLSQAQARIRELEGVLGRIETAARNAQPSSPLPQPLASFVAPAPEPQEDVTIPQGPAVELSDEDHLGDGRWA
jgi:hypothetical protein